MNVWFDDKINYESIDLILEKQNKSFKFKGVLDIGKKLLLVSITQFNKLNDNNGIRIEIDDHITKPGTYENKFKVIDITDYLLDRKYVEYKVQKEPNTRTG